MNIFQRLFGKKLASATSKHDLEMYQAQLDMEAMRLREEAQRMEMHKCYAQRREERAKKQGWNLIPGGHYMCVTCGSRVNILLDQCEECQQKLEW